MRGFSWLIQKIFFDGRDRRLADIERGQEEIKLSVENLHEKVDLIADAIQQKRSRRRFRNYPRLKETDQDIGRAA